MDPGPDTIWCFTRGKQLPMSDCVDNCAAPEQRPRCFAAHGIAHSFDARVEEPRAPERCSECLAIGGAHNPLCPNG